MFERLCNNYQKKGGVRECKDYLESLDCYEKSIKVDNIGLFHSKQDKSCMHFAKFSGLNALKISTFDVSTFQKSLFANLHTLPLFRQVGNLLPFGYINPLLHCSMQVNFISL